MGNWFHIEQMACLTCGNKWILRSDKLITDEQYFDWLDKAVEEHEEVHEVEEEE